MEIEKGAGTLYCPLKPCCSHLKILFCKNYLTRCKHAVVKNLNLHCTYGIDM